MGRTAFRWMYVACLAVALGLTACGASSSSSEPDSTTLRQGLLQNGQLGGMVKQGQATLVTSKVDWASQANLSSEETKAEVARLKKIGFVAGLSVPLVTKNNSNRYGVTEVEQFKSSSGPEAELTHTVSTDGPWTSFPIPGIPGARGFEQGGGGSGGRNVAFTHGDYFYLIGSGWQGAASNGVPQATMAGVALALYHRIAH